MSLSRNQSALVDIKRLRRFKNVRLHAFRKIGDRTEVHLSPDQVRKFILHVEEAKEARRSVGEEFHQKIHIRLVREVVAQDRAEEAELLDGIAPAEGQNPFEGKIDVALGGAYGYGLYRLGAMSAFWRRN